MPPRPSAEPIPQAFSPRCICLMFCTDWTVAQVGQRAVASFGARLFTVSSLDAATGLALARGFDLAILEGEPAALLGAAGRLRSLADLARGGAIVAVTRTVDERFHEAAALAGIDGLVETGCAAHKLPGLVRLLWPKRPKSAPRGVAESAAGWTLDAENADVCAPAALIELKPRVL